MLSHFRGGFVQTLLSVFPNIGLDQTKFDVVAQSRCTQITLALINSTENQQKEDVNHRRKWLSAFAKEQGYDPLVSDHWYSIARGTDVYTKVLIVEISAKYYLLWQ